MATGLVACDRDPVAPARGDAVTSSADVVTTAARREIELTCAPAALRVPRGSTTTAACSLTMPSNVTSSLTVVSTQFPRGVRLHLVGADSTNTLAAGSSTTIFLAADVDSVVTARQYTGTLLVKARGASRKVAIPLEVTTSAARVRMVYLIPADRTYDPDVAWGMERAARHLQIFYQQQLGAAGTFTLHWPVVDVVRSALPASYFAANAFYGVGQEVRTALGDRGGTPANVYAVYFDVVPTSATGGLTGLATLPHNDVMGITGRDPAEPIRRWVGGLGHELGHAFGLPHPPGCDAAIYTNDCWSLMYWGYSFYPSTFIAESQKSMLAASAYVQPAVTAAPVLFDADVLGQSLVPATPGATAGRVATETVGASAALHLQREQWLLASRARHR